MSPVDGLFQGRIRRRLSHLKQRLLQSEMEEERGGDRGWSPEQRMRDFEAGQVTRANRNRLTGSPIYDEPHRATHLPVFYPDAQALNDYEAGDAWDITGHLRAQLQSEGPAQKNPPKHLLLLFALGHCDWSDAQLAALEADEKQWQASHQALIFRAGDRLKKVYFRDIRLGDALLSVGTFPLILHFEAKNGAYAYRNLCLSPLSGGRSSTELEAYLAGENQVPQGSDGFFMSLCRGAFCQRIGAENHWSVDWSLKGLD